MTLRRAAQNVVDVCNRYGPAQSLRGWMEILEDEVNKCDRCGKVTRDGDVHTCTPRHDEPVAWTTMPHTDDWLFVSGATKPSLPGEWHPLFTHPSRRLTDEVIADLWARNGTYHHHFSRAIERWLKGQE
jgi:hypothetical protein